MEKQQHLVSITKELYSLTDSLTEQFEQTKTTGERGDFYNTVKPFADEVKQKIDLWQELSLQWVAMEKPKYIYEHQIKSVYEQIEMLSVQVFYPETSKSRFHQYVQSVRYILASMLAQLSNDSER